MVLEAHRCRIRHWQHGDVKSIVRHANNINVAKQLRDRFPHPYTPAHALEFLRQVAAVERPTNFAIEVDGEAAGAIGFIAGSDVERFSAEIGYWLGEQYWGRGVVTEALTLVTSYAFRSFHLLRLFALPFADNTASVRVLEKAGYVREATLKSSAVKYGRPRDQVIYAKINDLWTYE